MPHLNIRRNKVRRPSPATLFLLLGLIALTVGFLKFAPTAAHAASVFNVNSTGDGADSNTADNLCNDGTGNCTLRAAIQQANATPGDDIINLSVTGTINLTGTLPDIIHNLTINGPGSSLLTVRRNTGGDYRIFSVVNEETLHDLNLVVNISGLTVTNGRTAPGNSGEFGTSSGAGGGLVNGGTLTLTDVRLTGNSTGAGGAGSNFNGGDGGSGGAIYNFGVLTMTNVTLTGNSTGAGGAGTSGGNGGSGGAIYNMGTLTMNGCVVRGNSTGAGGAARAFGSNGGNGGSGGAIVGSFNPELTMTDCVVSENTTGAGGNSSGSSGRGGAGGSAGINHPGLLTLIRVSVSNNVAGAGGQSPLGTPGLGGRVGGISSGSGFSGSSAGTLIDSTVSGNVGGTDSGILMGTVFWMTNTTVSGNRLSGSGGGAVNNVGGFAATLTNCTITANEGTGLTVNSSSANVGNTIIAGNGGNGPDVSGSFNSRGHNLVGNVGGSTGFNAAGDRVGTSAVPLNPRLGPLADNGGPTLTHALLAGSPALDGGSNELAIDKDNNTLATDQRGTSFTRRADAADADTTQTVDIGAFEAHPSVEDVAPRVAARNTPLSLSFNVGDVALGITSVTAASNNQTLLPDANLLLSGTGSARTLQLTPAANLSGTATVTLTVNGANGRSMSDTFVLEVDLSNSAPSFTKGTDLSVAEDAGPQTFTNWATNINPGSPGEVGQSVSFVVTGNTNPGLFSAAPLVSPDGTLTFTPAPDANGSAAVTLVLKDNGGTTGGGQDTSAPQTFNVNVTAVNDAPVNTVPGPLTAVHPPPIIFSGANRFSVADVDAGTGQVKITLSTSMGALTLGGTAGLVFIIGDGTDDSTIIFTGTLANVNAALNGLIFTPSQRYTGAASIQLTTEDQGNTGAGGGGVDTDTALLTLTAVEGGKLLLFNRLSEVFEDAGTVPFEVWRFGGNAGATSVRFSTSNGTATGGATCAPGVDYINTSGTLNWADGAADDKSFTVALCNDSAHEPDETFIVSLSDVTGTAILDSVGVTMTIKDDDSANNRILFSQSLFRGGESSGSLAVTIRRTGNTEVVAGVDYATENTGSPNFITPCSVASGAALDRCDFTKSVGRIFFAAGEAEKTFHILLSDDSYVEGTESTTITLSNPDGRYSVGSPGTAVLEITDDVPETSANPIDDSAKFVRQHYHDFLGREPDAGGLQFWTNEIEQCGANAGCREVKRINVSAAFFLSIEFQETGYLAYRAHKAAFGSPGFTPMPITLEEMFRDIQAIGSGVVVNANGWEQKLEQNKRDYFDRLVATQRFGFRYPQSLTPEQFIDALNLNAGGVLSQAERDGLVAQLSSGMKTRAQALRAVADDENLSQAEFNKAFVLMQYFGYLRRNPDDLPDRDFTGWQFWFSKLNEFNGNFVNAEMVKAFIASDEYRRRFGP